LSLARPGDGLGGVDQQVTNSCPSATQALHPRNTPISATIRARLSELVGVLAAPSAALAQVGWTGVVIPAG
jgi:hypothetical protein